MSVCHYFIDKSYTQQFIFVAVVFILWLKHQVNIIGYIKYAGSKGR